MKQLISLLLVGALGLVVSLPLLWPLMRPEFFHMHDFTHVARLAEFNRALEDGHLPVRWSQNFGYGYGMPLFSFYAPLFYMIAEVFLVAGVGSIMAIKLAIGILFVAGFVSMYYLAKLFWGKSGGIISAIAFTYLPYRAVDVYVRGALSELTGITLVPVVLLSLFHLIRRPTMSRVAISGLAIGLLLLSHNLITLMALPTIVILVGGYYILSQKFSLKTVGYLGLSFLLGIGLAAFYLLPAFLEKGFTNVDSLTQGFSHYSQHFLYLRQLWHSPWGYGGSIYGLEDDVSFEIGKVQLWLLPVAGLLLIPYFFKKGFLKKIRVSRQGAAIVTLSLALIVALILMSTFKTQFIWDALPLLHFIQFPWRFLSLVVILVSLLSGSLVLFLPGRFFKIGVVIILTLLLVYFNKDYFKPKEYLENSSLLYYEDPLRIQTHMSGILPDFMPKGVPVDIATPSARLELVVDGQASAVPLEINRAQALMAQVELATPATLRINTFYFPGWKVYVNGIEVPFSVAPLPLPVLEFKVDPAQFANGEITISALLTETPLRSMSNLLSVMALLAMGVIWIYRKQP